MSRTCPAIALSRATRQVEAVFARAFEGLEIGGRQFSLLVALSRLGPSSIARVAEVTGLAPATLSRNLARLERDGIVAFETGTDRRQRCVGLTTRGRRVLSRALTKWRDAMQELQTTLGKRRLNELAAVLQDIGTALSEG